MKVPIRFVFALALIFHAPAIFAGDVFVNVNSDASFRSAVTGAGLGDVVKFHPDLDGETIFITNGEIAINETIAIDASDLTEGVTISGNDNSRIFNINGAISVVFDSFTIADGKSGNSADGGGILVTGGTTYLTLKNMTIANNLTGNGINGLGPADPGGDGGGIFNDGGNVTIINSTITGNQTGIGGTPSDTFTYSGGAGGNGAALANSGGTVTIHNSTIADNTCGAGVNGATGGVGGYGGGIWNSDSGTMTIINSTITGNQTGDTGGPGTPAGFGGGIFVDSGTVTITNTIVAENTRGDGGFSPSVDRFDLGKTSGTILRNGGNLIGENSGAEAEFPAGIPNIFGDLVGTVATPLSPALGALDGPVGSPAVRIPILGSPVIDRGTTSELPADICDIDGDTDILETLPIDQRGKVRVSNGRVDIGAVEDQLTYPIILAKKAQLRKKIKKLTKKAKIAKRKKQLAKFKRLKKKTRKLKKRLRSL